MMMKTDENNLKKVEAYLAKYGYPNKLEHGNKAVYGPWMVIHHQPNEPPRRRNFKYLYQAYLKEDLEEANQSQKRFMILFEQF